ncbi:MAG: hypothetical protein M3135_00960, partial [Actinomycetota bacterium]|nr:hypothetical protein [Actinomycetota bacterium]
EKTEQWSTLAGSAGERLGQVEVPREGLEAEQSAALAEAAEQMQRGLQMYSTLADEVGIAAQLEGDLQDQAIASVQEFLVLAGTTFDAGYSKLQTVRADLELPTGGGVPPGVPGGLPGGIPGLPGGEVPST